jgi:hypothetical protein
MLQKLFSRSLRAVFAPRPDISKASELVLVLNMLQREANSGSPEFFVQEVIQFRVTHPQNKKVRESRGYELIGYILRRQQEGQPLLKSRASLICWKESWRLLQGTHAFTVVVCEGQRKRSFATATRRSDCVAFDAKTLMQTATREGKPPCAT